ncbi:sexual stage-specific protein kinase [Plasmodium malariae]|uniref:Sexual stage-specific protein kinase n=1 Tax=Plasmodium malariae TaxID=5858 RepID=A0A1A8W404_PLAMA|nr:sexual stage-specific protein kinase [Plasmodium malariae]
MNELSSGVSRKLFCNSDKLFYDNLRNLDERLNLNNNFNENNYNDTNLKKNYVRSSRRFKTEPPKKICENENTQFYSSFFQKLLSNISKNITYNKTDDERENDERENDEMENDERENDERENDERENDEMENDERENDERENNEILNGKMLNGKMLNGKMLNGKMLNGKMLNGKMLNGKMLNDEAMFEKNATYSSISKEGKKNIQIFKQDFVHKKISNEVKMERGERTGKFLSAKSISEENVPRSNRRLSDSKERRGICNNSRSRHKAVAINRTRKNQCSGKETEEKEALSEGEGLHEKQISRIKNCCDHLEGVLYEEKFKNGAKRSTEREFHVTNSKCHGTKMIEESIGRKSKVSGTKLVNSDIISDVFLRKNVKSLIVYDTGGIDIELIENENPEFLYHTYTGNRISNIYYDYDDYIKNKNLCNDKEVNRFNSSFLRQEDSNSGNSVNSDSFGRNGYVKSAGKQQKEKKDTSHHWKSERLEESCSNKRCEEEDSLGRNHVEDKIMNQSNEIFYSDSNLSCIEKNRYKVIKNYSSERLKVVDTYSSVSSTSLNISEKEKNKKYYYIGETVNNVRNGWGMLIYNDRVIFEGEYKMNNAIGYFIKYNEYSTEIGYRSPLSIKSVIIMSDNDNFIIQNKCENLNTVRIDQDLDKSPSNSVYTMGNNTIVNNYGSFNSICNKTYKTELNLCTSERLTNSSNSSSCYDFRPQVPSTSLDNKSIKESLLLNNIFNNFKNSTFQSNKIEDIEKMRNVNVRDVNTRSLNMKNVNMKNVNMRNVNMRNVNMRNVNMRNVNMFSSYIRQKSKHKTIPARSVNYLKPPMMSFIKNNDLFFNRNGFGKNVKSSSSTGRRKKEHRTTHFLSPMNIIVTSFDTDDETISSDNNEEGKNGLGGQVGCRSGANPLRRIDKQKHVVQQKIANCINISVNSKGNTNSSCSSNNNSGYDSSHCNSSHCNSSRCNGSRCNSQEYNKGKLLSNLSDLHNETSETKESSTNHMDNPLYILTEGGKGLTCNSNDIQIEEGGDAMETVEEEGEGTEGEEVVNGFKVVEGEDAMETVEEGEGMCGEEEEEEEVNSFELMNGLKGEASGKKGGGINEYRSECSLEQSCTKKNSTEWHRGLKADCENVEDKQNKLNIIITDEYKNLICKNINNDSFVIKNNEITTFEKFMENRENYDWGNKWREAIKKGKDDGGNYEEVGSHNKNKTDMDKVNGRYSSHGNEKAVNSGTTDGYKHDNKSSKEKDYSEESKHTCDEQKSIGCSGKGIAVDNNIRGEKKEEINFYHFDKTLIRKRLRGATFPETHDDRQKNCFLFIDDYLTSNDDKFDMINEDVKLRASDYNKWSVNMLYNFLKMIGLKKEAYLFKINKVRGYHILKLTDKELKKLNINNTYVRKFVLSVFRFLVNSIDSADPLSLNFNTGQKFSFNNIRNICNSDIIILNKIGGGSYAQVFRAKYKGIYVACKLFLYNPKDISEESYCESYISTPRSSHKYIFPKISQNLSLVKAELRNKRAEEEEEEVEEHMEEEHVEDARIEEDQLSVVEGKARRDAELTENSSYTLQRNKKIKKMANLEIFRYFPTPVKYRNYEAKILYSLRACTNVIKLIGVCSLREGEESLILQYCPGGSLEKYIYRDEKKKSSIYTKCLSRPKIVKIFQQVAEGMYNVHSNQFFHRDLKLSNILLDENQNAIISDFGLSTYFSINDSPTAYAMYGNIFYAAPEVLKGEGFFKESDVWSFAVSLWEALTKKIAYDGLSASETFCKISAGELFLPIPNDIPSELSDLLRSMLQYDFTKRPLFDIIANKLEHIRLDAEMKLHCDIISFFDG